MIYLNKLALIQSLLGLIKQKIDSKILFANQSIIEIDRYRSKAVFF